MEARISGKDVVLKNNPKGMQPIVLTIDWEDFAQLCSKYQSSRIIAPDNNIERQTRIILDILNAHSAKATFFVLGITARYKKELVKEIHSRGHEIALHGMYHEHLGHINYKKIQQDIIESKDLVCNIIGEEVYGYRAPFFSLVKSRLHVLEILCEAGFLYDSSIFPSSIAKRGIGGFLPYNQEYILSNEQSIVELPATVFSSLGLDVPFSGGSYFRLMPHYLISSMVGRVLKHRPVMLYLHPYEFDTQELDVADNYPGDLRYPIAKRMLKNTWYNLLRRAIVPKINSVLNKHRSFSTCYEMAMEVKRKNAPRLLKSQIV